MRWHGHNKEADLADGFRIVGSDRPGLERVYVQLDTALEVGGLVLVDHVILGQFVQHGSHLREQYERCLFLRGVAQCLHRITGGFMVTLVPGVFHLGLAHSFLRRLMVCHCCRFLLFNALLVAHRRIELLFQE